MFGPPHGGMKNRNQIKYLALTFINTLLSSQRTHAHTSTSGLAGASVRQLLKLSSSVFPIANRGFRLNQCDRQALLVLPRFPGPSGSAFPPRSGPRVGVRVAL